MHALLLHFIVALGFTSITTLVLGAFVFLKNPRNKVNRVFAAYSSSIVWWSFFQIGLIAHTDKATALLWGRVEQIGVFFIPTLFVHFVLSLLDAKGRRVVLPFGYALSIVFASFSLSQYMIADAVQKFFVNHFATPGGLYIWAVVFFLAYTLYGLYILGKAYIRTSGLRKSQIKYLFWSSLLGYVGGSTNFLLVFDVNVPILNPFGTYAVPLYVFATAYAIVRYRLMDITLAITRTAVFTVVYTLVLGLPLVTAWVWQEQLRAGFGQYWWVWLWAGSSALATVAHYTNMYFQRRAEKRLLREQREYQHTLRQAAQGMTLVKDLSKLMNFIVHVLTRTVKVEYSGLWLLEPRRRKYVLKAARGKKGSPIGDTIEFAHVLVLYLLKEKGAIIQEELRLLIQDERWDYLKPVVNELERIGAAVLIPSFERAQLVGFLVLSEKKSGKLYTNDDLEVFEVLASQAALAIENAQFYEELKRAQADLFQTAKMASLGHMAGGMSHQVNNRFHVLSILAGAMKATLKDNDPTRLPPEKLKEVWDKTLETFTKVEENALRGGDIVKTILKFSRPSGDYQPVELPKVISTALEVVQFRVNFATLDLVQSFPEGLSPVKGDLNQLADSCFNLISNTYDATQKKVELINQGKLTLSPHDADPYRAKISIAGKELTEKGKKWVVLQVQDNGVGMTPQELDNLFIPFFTTKATAQKGTGLGLYIIQRIIEQHGGSIHATSEYGVGTIFTIKLPAARE